MEVNFNSDEYIWVDIIVILLGREATDLRGIEYKVESQMEMLFASEQKARDIQRGKREYEGTITLLQNKLIAPDRTAQEKGYEDIPGVSFDVIVSYVPASGVVITDKITGVSFTEIPRSMKEGDLKMEVALPLIALDMVSGAL